MVEMLQGQKSVEDAALAVPDKAQALVISNDEDLAVAGAMLVSIKGIQKQINACFDPIIKKAHSAHKEAVAQKKTAGKPLARAESIIKPKIAEYSAGQERIRKEEELRIQREEAERVRKIEEERLKKAEELEENGDAEAAEAVLSEPAPAAVVAEQPKAPTKVSGVAIKKVWKFRVIDVIKLPKEYMIPDEKLIGQAVRRDKDACSIPGVEVYSEDSVAARSN